MKNGVRGSRPQGDDARWSTALLLSFIVAIAFMFGSNPAKTGVTGSGVFTAKTTATTTAPEANEKKVVMGNMQITSSR
jgi:hypothetical protein